MIQIIIKKSVLLFYYLIFNYFCRMKTINLREITESMSEREMKLVKGGLDQPMVYLDNQLGGGNGTDCNSYPSCGTAGNKFCDGKNIGDACITNTGTKGICKCWPDPLGSLYCKICFTG